jgi:hypothetical protein
VREPVASSAQRQSPTTAARLPRPLERGTRDTCEQ